jgi:hypothetical protein
MEEKIKNQMGKTRVVLEIDRDTYVRLNHKRKILSKNRN